MRFVRRWWAVLLPLAVWAGMMGGPGLIGNRTFERRLSRFKAETACDFRAYYAAGLCVLENRWDALYAQQDPVAARWLNSRLKEKGKSWGPSDSGTIDLAFVHPPASALFYVPFALLDFPEATRLWSVCHLIAFVLFLALVKRSIERDGSSRRLADIVVLGIGLGATAIAVMQAKNLNPFYAVLVSWMLRGFETGGIAGPASAVFFMGATKGFSAVWVPFLFSRREWKILFLLAVFGSVLLLLAWVAGCSSAEYSTLFRDVFPYVKGVLAGESFQRLAARMAMPAAQVAALPHLPRAAAAAFSLAWILPCLTLYAIDFRAMRSRRFDKVARRDLLELSLMLSLLLHLSCSNLCWTHYRIFVLAFVPTGIRICRRFRRLSAVFYSGLVLFLLFPASNPFLEHNRYYGIPNRLPESFFFGQAAYLLWIVFATVALITLLRPDGRSAERQRISPGNGTRRKNL